MKREPIVKNYKNVGVPGVEIMSEQISYMASKMMDIEDIIDITYTITPQDLTDYTIYTSSGATNIPMEKYLDHKNKFSYDDIKKKHVILSEDTKQKIDEINYNTKWVFKLDSKDLLREYLYDEFFVFNKKNDFIDIKNKYPDYVIKDLVRQYIDDNIIDRYRFKSFRLYVKYFKLEDNIVEAVAPQFGNHNGLDKDIKLFIKKPIFDIKALDKNTNNIVPISMDQHSDGTIYIYYKQDKSSKKWTFLYYFDVIYEKI